jgi:hypothetical protein
MSGKNELLEATDDFRAAIAASERASQRDDLLQHCLEARAIDGYLLDHLQRRPRIQNASDASSVSRDLQTEITYCFRRKDDRCQLGKAILLNCERKRRCLCGGAGDPFEAGNVLSHEKKSRRPAPCCSAM